MFCASTADRGTERRTCGGATRINGVPMPRSSETVQRNGRTRTDRTQASREFNHRHIREMSRGNPPSQQRYRHRNCRAEWAGQYVARKPRDIAITPGSCSKKTRGIAAHSDVESGENAPFAMTGVALTRIRCSGSLDCSVPSGNVGSEQCQCHPRFHAWSSPAWNFAI